jgi:hypothetical protein
MNRRSQEKYELLSATEILHYEIVVRSGAAEVGLMLQESTIQNIKMKTWSGKFPECGNGKRRGKKV